LGETQTGAQSLHDMDRVHDVVDRGSGDRVTYDADPAHVNAHPAHLRSTDRDCGEATMTAHQACVDAYVGNLVK
jgi:hypothetical protein